MQGHAIAVWAGTGIGGTEKCATIFACALKKRGHRVFFLGKKGPRSDILTEHEVPLVDVETPEALQTFLLEEKIDVIHQHVPGYPVSDLIYDALEKMKSCRPKLIETNVFGRLEDPRSLRLVDYRMFICQASGTQAFRRAKWEMDEKALARQTVVNYPVTSSQTLADNVVLETRKSLGVESEELLAVRFGRPGNKWSTWECEAFAKARKQVKKLRLLLMEPSEGIWRDVEAGHYGNGIILRRATTDFAWLGRLYNAADFSIHSSDWGESFGYTIAEAMAANLPVITMSTPWGDNAQVELIQNGVTGFVCRGPEEMSRRICDLANPQLRKNLGNNGRVRIGDIADLEQETDMLEAVISATLTGRESPLLKERRTAFLAFAKNFHQLESHYSESRWVDPVATFRRLTYSIYRQARAAVRNQKKRVSTPLS